MFVRTGVMELHVLKNSTISVNREVKDVFVFTAVFVQYRFCSTGNFVLDIFLKRG